MGGDGQYVPDRAGEIDADFQHAIESVQCDETPTGRDRADAAAGRFDGDRVSGN